MNFKPTAKFLCKANMSFVEKTNHQKLKTETVSFSSVKENKLISLIDKFFGHLSSVRFGIFLLILLLVLCLAGMLIRQSGSIGFENYFVELSSWEKELYLFFGLFDIYHSWYFYAVLFLLSLNILSASFEHFPQARKFLSQPKTIVSKAWLKSQKHSFSLIFSETENEVLEKLKFCLKKNGWSKIKVTKEENRTIVFAEKNAWNRLGAYFVHLALLLILFGGFLNSQLGFSGQVYLSAQQTISQLRETSFENGELQQTFRKLPFTVFCQDIEQKLIDFDGTIEPENTFDWLTHLEISDEYGTRTAVIQLNQPFDYRGYRFFHSDFLRIGKARTINLEVRNSSGEISTVSLKHNENIALPDKTNIRFVDFRANSNLQKEAPNENSTRYQNPAAVLEVSLTNKPPKTVYVFPDSPKNSPFSSTVENLAFRLLSFEKVSEQHLIHLQRDSGLSFVYFGFFLMSISLFAVFGFSHQRVWGIISTVENQKSEIIFGGNTNRNSFSFKEKLIKITEDLKN